MKKELEQKIQIPIEIAKQSLEAIKGLTEVTVEYQGIKITLRKDKENGNSDS